MYWKTKNKIKKIIFILHKMSYSHETHMDEVTYIRQVNKIKAFL